MERYEVATRKILSMQECIEKNDRKGFVKVMNGHTLHNCTVGDTFLQEKVISVFRQALEKFV